MPNLFPKNYEHADPMDYFNSEEFKQEQRRKEKEYERIVKEEWTIEDELEYQRWMRGE